MIFFKKFLTTSPFNLHANLHGASRSPSNLHGISLLFAAARSINGGRKREAGGPDERPEPASMFAVNAYVQWLCVAFTCIIQARVRLKCASYVF